MEHVNRIVRLDPPAVGVGIAANTRSKMLSKIIFTKLSWTGVGFYNYS